MNPIRITHYLRQRGMSQAELARRVRVNPATISRIASGKQYLTERMENQIAHELNLSDDERNHMLGFPLGAGRAAALRGASVAGREYLQIVGGTSDIERDASA